MNHGFSNLINNITNLGLLQCSISECKLSAEKTVKISFRETRNLCKKHYQIFVNKNKEHKVNFTKASEYDKN